MPTFLLKQYRSARPADALYCCFSVPPCRQICTGLGPVSIGCPTCGLRCKEMAASVNKESDRNSTLQAACQMAQAHTHVWFEPVSVPKAVRATQVLGRLTYTSPNAHELIAMAAAIDPLHNTEAARQLLLQMAAGSNRTALGQLQLLAPFMLSVLKVDLCQSAAACTPNQPCS